MSGKNALSPVTRRQAVATVAVGVGLMATPAILRAQTPLTVSFVQQRGLLYLPVDEMVSGGILQQEATKLGLGKVEATVSMLSGPAPVIDALLSGSADYGTAALPSLLTLWDKTHGTQNEIGAVIYARVSTDQGLEQDFNSLDAQYDPSQAYIRSAA